MSTIEEYINNIDPNLLEFIKENDLIVSGSSALYYYMLENGLNPGFKLTDLDIYCCNLNLISEHLSLTDYEIELDTTYDQYKEDFFEVIITRFNNIKIDFIKLYGNYDGFSDSDSDSEMEIDNKIKNYNKNKNKNYIINSIDETFDFEFNKCYYDGEKIIALNPESVKLKYSKINLKYKTDIKKHYNYLTLKELNNYKPGSILDKIKWNNVNDKYNIINRTIKYKSRGFTINLLNILKKYNKRKKYNICDNFIPFMKTNEIEKYYNLCYNISEKYENYNLIIDENEIELSYIKIFVELRYKYLYVDLHKEIIESYWNPKNLPKLIENGEIDEMY